MNLAFIRERYSYYSGKASDIVRQLAFAGIALVWLFKTEIKGQWGIPTELFPAAGLIVLTLSLDFLQYAAGSLIWAAYNKVKESAHTADEAEFLAPRLINWPTNFFFWTKVVTNTLAYWLILRFLARRIFGAA
jgi:hypothetical protein